MTTPDESTDKPKHFAFSLSQILGGALAAATASFLLQAVLDLGRGDRGRVGIDVDSQPVGNLEHHRHFADVAAVDPVGAEHGVGELPRLAAVLAVQPSKRQPELNFILQSQG